jgi:glycosyltransferase involved in cell wall biosynthesis
VLVSVITPTWNRERFLPQLLACFGAQTYPELELLILDDSARPAALFQPGGVSDPRIRYTHLPARMTIGEKRNRLVEQARGSIVVQFDDDDYYAPRYVERMVQNLGNNDLVKLGGWFGYSVPKGEFFYWDTSRMAEVHLVLGPGEPLAALPVHGDVTPFIEKNLWGYGFSYVFRKHAFRMARFESLDLGEDYAFTSAVRAAGCSVSYCNDTEGLVLHILHGDNISRVFPQYILPPFLLQRIFPAVPGTIPP